MLPSSRIRRLREFIIFMEAKYQPEKRLGLPEGKDPVQRIRQMKDHLLAYIEAFKPRCYWCRRPIERDAFETRKGQRDTLTVHHVDEDRSNNEMENLELCHRTCHQEMHKLSTKTVLPARIVAGLVWGEAEVLNAK